MYYETSRRNLLGHLIKSLQEASEMSFKWFNNNLMKNNAEEYYLLFSTNNTAKIKIGNVEVTDRKWAKFDNKLSFDHTLELRRKASR